MADVFRPQIAGIVQRNEAVAVRAVAPVQLGTDEAVVVTVQKPSEAAFGATAGTTLTQIQDVLYQMDIDPGDIDELGLTWFKLTGATSTTYCCVMVVDYDPYTEGAMSDLALKHRAASPG